VISDQCVVTGAGGFIGYQLANALADEGRRVTGVDLQYPNPHGVLGPPRFSPLVADFRNLVAMTTALAGAEVLFHLASAHLQISLPDSEYWDVNFHSLPPLLQLASAAGVRRIVHTSSVAVYGNVGSTPADEQTPARPQSIYGETKLAGEQLVLEFGHRHGLDVIVLRPSWVYGPGCSRTRRICKALRARRFVMVGAGRNLRHPLYIADMIEAFRLAATASDISGELLVVAGDRAVTTRELIKSFCEAFDLPRPFIRVPYAAGVVMAHGTEFLCRVIGREPPVSRRSLEFFDTSNAFDISRARAVLGFVPQYSLSTGLRATRRCLETGPTPREPSERTYEPRSA
jgi:nucleoside-diphosphate-sugar epimerase